jgi:hypothetical protein
MRVREWEAQVVNLRKMIRVTLLVAVIAGVAGILYVWAGHRLTLLFDRLWLRTVESRRLSSISVSDGLLNIRGRPLETGAGFLPAMADDRLAIIWRDRKFVLGPAHAGRRAEFDVTPEDGDEATFEVAHSVLSWPTPFEFNFMTGVSPSWKRYRYYRLSWKKHNGETLRATWRYEQWHYSSSGWSDDMVNPDFTGLISLE